MRIRSGLNSNRSCFGQFNIGVQTDSLINSDISQGIRHVLEILSYSIQDQSFAIDLFQMQLPLNSTDFYSATKIHCHCLNPFNLAS